MYIYSATFFNIATRLTFSIITPIPFRSNIDDFHFKMKCVQDNAQCMSKAMTLVGWEFTMCIFLSS